MRTEVGERRPRVTKAVVTVTVMALIAIGLVSAPAFGEDPPEHPTFSNLPNEGVLRLHLGSDGNSFQYQVWDGSAYVTPMTGPSSQPVGPPIRCELKGAKAVDGPLADITSSEGNVGMDGFDIGSSASGSRGVPCGQVDATEGVLSVSLHGSGPLADKEIDYAEIDIEGKHDVMVTLQAYLENVAVGDPVVVVDCMTDADCGPDSADGDNFRVKVAVAGQPAASEADAHVVDGVFDRFDLEVTSAGGGEFSLNGGSDGTDPGPLGIFLDTSDTLLHLTDATLITCDVPEEVGGGEFGGTYLLTNCDGTKSVAFQFDGDSNEVTITNAGSPISDSYLLEFWTFLPVPADPEPELYYDDGFGEFLTPYCLIDPRNVDSTTGERLPSLPSGLDPLDVLPENAEATTQSDGVHTTCKIVDARTTVGQEPSGSGTETVLKAEFTLFSIADASRQFR